MVWTGDDDIVTVALLELFLYEGPNGVWYWRWHCSSDDEGGSWAYKIATPSLSGKRSIHGLIFERIYSYI